jgi:hypothetical protein
MYPLGFNPASYLARYLIIAKMSISKKMVLELCRGFLEKTLCEYFGNNNRVQIISVKDAIDKIKARQLSAGYKKPLLTKREMQIM